MPVLVMGQGVFAMRMPAAAANWLRRWEKLERVKGIEPSYSAWKAAALPLSYTRAAPLLIGETAFAKAGLHDRVSKKRKLVGEVGLEPTKA